MAVPDVNQMRSKFFEGRRADIERQGRGQMQEAGDSLKRRFASLGQVGSGAAIAAEQKAREGIQANVSNAQNELAGQEYAAEAQSAEAELGRKFSSDQAAKDMQFKKQLFDVEQGNKVKEIDLAERQFQLDKDTTAFNRRLAELESGKEDPGLLGGGGFLGTGLKLGQAGETVANIGAPVFSGVNKMLGGGGK